MSNRRRAPFLALALAAAVTLAGCAHGVTAPDWNQPVPIQAHAPGKQVSRVPGVSYYPACGTELLTYDGTVWYPFTPERPQDFPTPVAMSVVAPGPGDDVGTLTIFDNCIAFFVSDSGRLSRWLTTQQITYNWAC